MKSQQDLGKVKSQQDLEKLKPFEARAVIESLRKGSVPMAYVQAFTVGREKWLHFIEDDLDLYISEGGAKVRFVNGDYGDGKTHFMSVVRHLALERDYAVSFVVLTREVPIHKFELVYQSIVRQLAGRFEGQGVRALISQWLDGLEAASAGGAGVAGSVGGGAKASRRKPGEGAEAGGDAGGAGVGDRERAGTGSSAGEGADADGSAGEGADADGSAGEGADADGIAGEGADADGSAGEGADADGNAGEPAGVDGGVEEGAAEAGSQAWLTALANKLRTLPGMDLSYANALVALAENRLLPLKEGETREDRNMAQEVLFQWLEGAKVTKRDLKTYQIFELLNKTNSKRFLGSLVAFLKYLDYKGLILLLDELETVLAQSASVRNASYENVRLLIDNTESARYLHIFFSIIPDVIATEKGFKSYDALWSRVRSISEGKRLNYRSVLVDLHRTPLETRELIELGLRLRRIHEMAYRWDASTMPDAIIEKVCATQKRMGLLSEVRLFVKQIVRLLDMAEQGIPVEEEMDLTEVVETSQRELEEEKLAQLQPKWDT